MRSHRSLPTFRGNWCLHVQGIRVSRAQDLRCMGPAPQSTNVVLVSSTVWAGIWGRRGKETGQRPSPLQMAPVRGEPNNWWDRRGEENFRRGTHLQDFICPHCRPVEVQRRFGRPYCLYLQGRRVNQARTKGSSGKPMLCFFYWFRSCLTVKPWRWRQCDRPKRGWTYSCLHGVTSQYTTLFGVATVRASNPNYFLILYFSCVRTWPHFRRIFWGNWWTLIEIDIIIIIGFIY
jgi:hypothetical protein